MSNFKVGDMAIGQNFVTDVQFNGMECEIIGNYDRHLGIGRDGDLRPIEGYKVLWANGKKSIQKEYQLKKKYDGDNVVDWETCLWKPTEELA